MEATPAGTLTVRLTILRPMFSTSVSLKWELVVGWWACQLSGNWWLGGWLVRGPL